MEVCCFEVLRIVRMHRDISEWQDSAYNGFRDIIALPK